MSSRNHSVSQAGQRTIADDFGFAAGSGADPVTWTGSAPQAGQSTSNR
ncbi:hypothetical protein [Desertimonas flava]|nr:hypothetical protein [Desertimonas flava]